MEAGAYYEDSAYEEAIPEARMAERAYDEADTGSSLLTENRKMIRTVSITMKLPSDADLPGTVADISNIVSRHGGVITGNEMSYERDYAGGTLNIQVPKAKVDAFLDDMKGSGHTITGINDSSRDVTAEYVDTEARIKVQEQKIENYQKYLEEAQNVSETLEISDRLNNAIADLEANKARMNAMKSQIEYTSISVRITCETAVNKQSLSEKIRESLSYIGENFVDAVLDGLEWFTEAVAHLIFILPIVWVFVRVIVSAFRKRKSEPGKKRISLPKFGKKKEEDHPEPEAEKGEEEQKTS